MSYNTRRTNNYGARGNLSQNFVSGGQFQPTSKPVVQMPRPPQKPGFPPQQKPVGTPLKSALKNPTTPQNPTQQFPQKTLQQVHPKPEPVPDTKEEEKMDTDIQDIDNEEMNEDGTTNGTKKKSFWRHIKAGAGGESKISKKERRGRRNQRLRKILQPKNALMVVNELVGGQKYNVIETQTNGGENNTDNFAATVVIDSQEYTGYGKNKSAAKSAAAEVALRSLLLSKLRTAMSKSQNASQTSLDEAGGDVTMSESDDNKDPDKQDEEDVSWLHVASYAIHKLFTAWDADGVLPENTFQHESYKNTPAPKAAPKRPAKQLPANAELMNPVMLLNQMRPGVVYEDHEKEGTPPAMTFTVKAVCDDEDFFGKGNNKKIARKNCAYAACSKIFNIQYPEQDTSATQ